jgi:hypothetical protein
MKMNLAIYGEKNMCRTGIRSACLRRQGAMGRCVCVCRTSSTLAWPLPEQLAASSGFYLSPRSVLYPANTQQLAALPPCLAAHCPSHTAHQTPPAWSLPAMRVRLSLSLARATIPTSSTGDCALRGRSTPGPPHTANKSRIPGVFRSQCSHEPTPAQSKKEGHHPSPAQPSPAQPSPAQPSPAQPQPVLPKRTASRVRVCGYELPRKKTRLNA